VTFTLGVATQFLRSAHRLNMVIIFAKLFEIFFIGLKVMERTWKCYGRTDAMRKGVNKYGQSS
jgi:hypothetical protein